MSFPGKPWGQCLTLGCPRLWTSPRWSWTFSSYIFRISGPKAPILSHLDHTNQLCFNNIAKKSFRGKHWSLALLLSVRGSVLHPDGHGHSETTQNNYSHHTKQLLSQQHCQKVIPWDKPGSGPTTGCPRLCTSPRWSWTSRNNLK